MHRTTILLPEDLKLRASKRARRDGLSLSELIRSALEEKLAAQSSWANDPLWKALEPIDFPDSPGDLAANHDDYLYELLEEELRQGR